MIVAGGTFTIGKAKLEGQVLGCIRRWAENYPDQVVNFRRQMDQERANLRHDGSGSHVRGLSGERSNVKIGSVPTTLYHMMRREVDKDWLDDRDIQRVFWSYFNIGRINHNA